MLLCLPADPLGFEDPPLGIPAAERSRHGMNMITATAQFLCSVPAPFPPTPCQRTANACSKPADPATTMDSLDGLTASFTSVHGFSLRFNRAAA
jgi:hypothetical protein